MCSMAMLRRRSKRKGIILLALICICSSSLLRVCIQGERLYQSYYRPHEESKLYERKALRLPLNGSRVPLSAAAGRPREWTWGSCAEEHCADRLSAEDKSAYSRCRGSALSRGALHHSSCRFLDKNSGNRRGPVALASFPGSGNTWVRGLLQKATGLCTGSLYCDRDLRRHGFPGEDIHSDSVLVTKTHQPNAKTKGGLNFINFTSAVLIIRNPFDAIVSERNRQILHRLNAHGKNKSREVSANSSHLLTVGKNYFGNNKEWDHWMKRKVNNWKNMIRFWLSQWDGPVLIVKYEHLKENSLSVIKRILEFIGHGVNEVELERRLHNGYSKYHRSKHGNFTYYTPQQVETVNQYIAMADRLLNQTNYTTVSLKSYIR